MTKSAKKSKQKLLSVVIPAYKAEAIIEESLKNVSGLLKQMRYDFEIICVVDGKVDETFKKAKNIASKDNNIKVVGYERNLGKGHAVRYGMSKAKGDYIAFIDADLDLDPNGLAMLIEHFEWYNADIMIGSKRHPASKVTYPWQRKLLSFGYQALVRVLFGLKVRDTQVGLKLFKKEVVEDILPRLLVKTFAFDIEMLSVANYLGYKRIFEAPVDLEMQFKASTITSKGFVRTVADMLWDTMAVFYRLKILRYYRSKNKKNWITPEYLKEK